MRAIEIAAPGPFTTVQDRGRFGYAAMGVGRSGAADIRSHDTANRLVGNKIDAATLETTMGGLQIRAHGPIVVAVTGAPGPITLNGVADGSHCTLQLSDGDELSLGPPTAGLRNYLAVRGGIGVEPVLGSRSTDTLAGVGPEPVAVGNIISVGNSESDWPATDFVPTSVPQATLRVVPGPRDDWFRDAAVLFDQTWAVTADSDRVGIRLDGAHRLHRAVTDELPSEGMVPGALQIPPDGKPVVFLADHPVTGGYPVIGVVCSADLPTLGQLRPGDSVRFARTTPA